MLYDEDDFLPKGADGAPVSDESEACTRDFLRSKDAEIFQAALQHMQYPPVAKEAPSWEDSMQALVLACGALCFLSISPDLVKNTELVVFRALPRVLVRMQEMFDTSPTSRPVDALDLECRRAYEQESDYLFEGASDLFLVVREWTRSEQRDIICRSRSFATLVFTTWARYHNEGNRNDDRLMKSVIYLTYLNHEHEGCEDIEKAYRHAFGNGARFAKSFISNLCRYSELPVEDLRMEQLKTSILILLVLDRMIVSKSPFHEHFRDTLRENNVSAMSVAFIAKARDVLLSSKHAEERQVAERALECCLPFLISRFREYDGELWATGALRKGLLPNIFSLEDIMSHLPTPIFHSYQHVLYGLVALSRNERFFNLVFATLVRIWKSEDTGSG